MKVWAMVSQKGGSGKSTLAIHLAAYAASHGRTVVLIDCDPQRSAERWARTRGEDGRLIIVAGDADHLAPAIDAARNGGADLVIIDTAPRMEKAALIAVKAADYIVTPVRPTVLDAPAALDTVELAGLAKRKDRTFVVLNACPSRSSLPKDTRDIFVEAGVAVCPHILGNRLDYQKSLIDGQGVTEATPSSKAASELKAVFQWIDGGGKDAMQSLIENVTSLAVLAVTTLIR